MTAGALFVGPPLGSLLFGIAVGLPFGVNAASFLVSAGLLAGLRRTTPSRPVTTSLRRSVGDGVRWLRSDRLLRVLAVLLGVNNFCGQFGAATLVLLATHTLHVSATGYGVLLGAAAVGAVVGGLVDAPLVSALGETPAVLLALVGMASAYLVMGLAPDAQVLGAGMALNGFFVSLWNVVTVSLRQALVPRELLGRVNSVYRMLGWGFMPLGALAGGVVADRFGLRAPYAAAAAIRVVAGLLTGPALVAALRTARARRAGAGRP
jgi:MFS family permease